MFNDISDLFSGTNYVTANMFFYKICEIRSNIKEWSFCDNPLMEAMSVSMEAKFRKYWTDIQGLMGIAIMLDPRFKQIMLVQCFEVLLGTIGIDCEYEVEKVRNSLADLMLEYNLEEDEGTCDGSSSKSAAPMVGIREFRVLVII